MSDHAQIADSLLGLSTEAQRRLDALRLVGPDRPHLTTLILVATRASHLRRELLARAIGVEVARVEVEKLRAALGEVTE